MNGLYTSYLGFFNRKKTHKTISWVDSSVDKEWADVFREKKCFELLFVMRDRGNNEVAPSKELLFLLKNELVSWEEYEKNYLMDLEGSNNSAKWMALVALKAEDHNVVLVCFEKNSSHCHRRLLAERIAELYGVEYKGELSCAS